MDNIILGFLMIQGSTIYELRQFIKKISPLSAVIVLEVFKQA